jgi:Crinkler effector protein N-terminal domain
MPSFSVKMTDIVTLFCLVEGESTANAFTIKIPPTNTIDDLKKLIKKGKSPKFDDIAADKLKLWSVSIPADDANTLKNLVLENNKDNGVQELLPMDDIADVFPAPPKKYIHIIVERPLCTGKCIG